MKISKWIFFLVLIVSPFVSALTKKACDDRMFGIMRLIAEAEACRHDDECMITQAFSDKLVCGKNRAMNRKAEIKKIIAAIDSVQDCPEGGSCYHQDLNEPIQVKCIYDRCQILKK